MLSRSRDTGVADSRRASYGTPPPRAEPSDVSHCLATTVLSVWLSSVCSATTCLSRRCSSSTLLQRLPRAEFHAAALCFPLVDVGSCDHERAADYGDLPSLRPLRRSGEFAPFHRSSQNGGPHSTA